MALLYAYILVVWLCVMGAAFFMGLDWLKDVAQIINHVCVGAAAIFGMAKFEQWKKEQRAKNHREAAVRLHEASIEFFSKLLDCRANIITTNTRKRAIGIYKCEYKKFDREFRIFRVINPSIDKCFNEIQLIFVEFYFQVFFINQVVVSMPWNYHTFTSTGSKTAGQSRDINSLESNEVKLIKYLSIPLANNFFGRDEVGDALRKKQDELFKLLEPYLNYGQNKGWSAN